MISLLNYLVTRSKFNCKTCIVCDLNINLLDQESQREGNFMDSRRAL